MHSQYDLDVKKGDRFEFGKNWSSFLRVLDDERIAEACGSLDHMLGSGFLTGKAFLDVGSGSGLFSLAAMRLGASRVHSFDYDPNSVRCTAELKRRYFPDAGNWVVEQGSVLDAEYLARLGQFDGLDDGAFKDLAAVSRDQFVFSVPFAAYGGRLYPGQAGAPLVSFIAPSLLFEELTLKPATGELPRLPLSKHPFFEK